MASAVTSPTVDKKTAKPKGSVRRALDLSDDTHAKQPQQAKTFHSNENVIAAAALLVNDQPRFDKIHGLMKNQQKEIADEVTRAFRPAAKVKAREWMTANVGTPPEAAGARLTKLELAQICLVSIALTKYGIEKLNQLYDSKRLEHFEDVALHSYELRSNGQAKYRDHSSSKQKETKDVAHYAGLDFVLNVNAELPEQRRVARATLQTVLNDPSNFRMVKLEWSRSPQRS